MGGVAVLLMLLAYIGIGFFVAGRLRQERTREVFFILFAVAPFLDAQLGRWALHRQCEIHPAATVYKSLANVEGICFRDDLVAPSTAKSYGYRFVESRVGTSYSSKALPYNHVYRVSNNGTSNGVVEGLVQPAAEVEISKGNSENNWYFRTEEHLVVRERVSGDLLGVFTVRYFKGGWVEHLLAYCVEKLASQSAVAVRAIALAVARYRAIP